MKDISINIPRQVIQSRNSIVKPDQNISSTKKIQNYLFNLNQIIGKGNFSHVYKGVNTINNEIVAIKVIQLSMMKDPSFHNLLSSEIDILSNIKHPNILNCLEVFTSVNNCYIITELCDIDLQTMIIKRGALQQKTARKIIFDIFEGLKYLAQKQIVHRDIKIANIFIKDGVTKIADFGFAKKSNQNFKDISVGSPIYMSPQGLISNIYGPKTDVWALGVVIFQILHGDPPLGFCQSQNELRLCINKPIREQSFKQSISQQLKHFIMKCLQVNQLHRPSMFELQKHPYIEGLQKEFGKYIKINNQNFNSSRKSSLKSIIHPLSHKTINIQPPLGQLLSPTQSNFIKRYSLNPPSNSFIKLINISSSNSEKSDIQNPLINFQIVKSKLTFYQALQLLHYCRLLFKARQLILLQPHLCKSLIAHCFGNYILGLITELKFKSKNFVTFSGPKAVSLQQKFQDVSNEYFDKYTSTISKNLQVKSNNQQLRKCCIETLKSIDKIPKQVINRKDQIVVCVYVNYIYDVNKIIDECLQKRNYSSLIQKVNIEHILKIKYQQFDETHYLPIKTKLMETQRK